MTITTQRVHWDPNYDVHLGATWGRFMTGLTERKILANRCPDCSRVFVPPQAYCESFFVRTGDWLELPPEGVVEAFPVAWQSFRGGPTPPYAIAGIRLEGASTLLMHYVQGLDLSDSSGVREQLPPGTRVRAVWAEERTGQILDIAHFEKA
ncbi:Zn-ribbon domain-containing OB-fold protein [Amycolatopsis thermalba]|uniref:Zn-ribbon domain-containing OB-fold protein n=1 Tax=Amycolatopsis thermalba TaxID=944492 RepID=A0ABY4NXI0_9PSEU|nr:MULTISPECIES: Zn-ribbon domain-containing OB-fold protein [Amycolatopsis]UQS24784.1 Zn-ribbon domain-containing OB-fold protein [Amycolatopsis thermalba]